jgi:hypothetical protein
VALQRNGSTLEYVFETDQPVVPATAKEKVTAGPLTINGQSFVKSEVKEDPVAKQWRQIV